MVSRLTSSDNPQVIDQDGEVKDISLLDPAQFKTFSQLPEPLQAKLRGRPKAERTKEAVKIRLDADILAALRTGGDGWQTRLNDTLRASLMLGGKLP